MYWVSIWVRCCWLKKASAKSTISLMCLLVNIRPWKGKLDACGAVGVITGIGTITNHKQLDKTKQPLPSPIGFTNIALGLIKGFGDFHARFLARSVPKANHWPVRSHQNGWFCHYSRGDGWWFDWWLDICFCLGHQTEKRCACWYHHQIWLGTDQRRFLARSNTVPVFRKLMTCFHSVSDRWR